VVQAFGRAREAAGDAVVRHGLVPNPGKPWILSVTKPEGIR
jgi:hypothetical protein